MNISYKNKTFCQNVLRLMRKNGLSEKEMIEIMQISKVSFNKLKDGFLSNRITVDTLMLLCKRFNVSPHEILDDEL